MSVIKKCEVCGKEYEEFRTYQKYCSESCKRKANRRCFYGVKIKKEKVLVKTNNTVDDSKCKKCRYSMMMCGQYVCDKLSMTGKRRESEYGINCTDFKDKNSKIDLDEYMVELKRRNDLDEQINTTSEEIESSTADESLC